MPDAACVLTAAGAEELFLDVVQQHAIDLLCRAFDKDAEVLILGSGCRGIKRR